MSSTNVDCYSYNELHSSSIEFATSEARISMTSSHNFKGATKLDITPDTNKSPTGTFRWTVNGTGGNSPPKRQQPMTISSGTLAPEGDFAHFLETPAIVTPDKFMITYGFYESDKTGKAGLVKSHQSWVSVVKLLADWMGECAPLNSENANKPFSTFILAGAHDAGMNTADTIDQNPGLIHLTGFTLSRHALVNLSMTQKDTFSSMLNNGVRYFDFRPAYLPAALDDEEKRLYHIHSIIPGARFDLFLGDVVTFLKEHTTEIVVVRTSPSGIKKALCEVPTMEVIKQVANEALAGSGISLGDRSCFKKTIASLRSSGERLILVPRDDNLHYSSYDSSTYATLSPKPIIERFEKMDTAGQSGKDLTILQCQGTPVAIPGVLKHAAKTAETANSPNLSTKASFDMETHPWIRENAMKNLTADQNIIILDDFIDGMTTHTAFLMSKARFGGKIFIPVLP